MTNEASNSPDSIADKVEAKLCNARLRILILGAGIAGSTLASLLKQRGEKAVVIERQGPVDAGGYMLGVLPLGGRVLNGLNLREQFDAISVPMRTYELYDRHGNHHRSFPLAPIIDAYGDCRGITRLELLNLLRKDLDNIIFDTSIESMEQGSESVSVQFSDGSTVDVDLVVGAEGVHSQIRKCLWSDDEVETFDTRWGGYVLWSQANLPSDTYSELWSEGWGIGIYPVRDRVGVFVGGNIRKTSQIGAKEFIEQVHAKVPADSCFAEALNHAEIDENPFFWPMTDIRVKTSWSKGRAVLIGDACASFLPTAGIGASTAMDSAAALADELSRADTRHMHYALNLFEKRQRHRVEKTQKNSRRLSRIMFVDSPIKNMIRDQAMSFYSLKSMVHDISQVIEGD
jgi:2-polyprenyl-6-methoxyphenol hydroxylase-like FAD-dependent oxidoreductase